MNDKDREENLLYLKQNNFNKYLKYLNKHLKDKRVVVYGMGILFQLINEVYKLDFNIVGVSDLRFSEDTEFLGYQAVNPNKIIDLKPDIILVSTKKYLPIAMDLKKKKELKSIKIRPLVKTRFKNIIKEIMES